mmetsp:Transcript_72908/g.126612  ORF Transcript_72908/g.126612 Transcript_72908/m.126612 type:complete len:329 (+) Transcript_72908:86-1072(+)
MLKAACQRCCQGSRSKAAAEGPEYTPGQAAPLPCSEFSSLELLPPLPTPNYVARQQEALLGCITVFSFVSIFVGTTNAVTFSVKDMPSEGRWIMSVLIWSEAAVALMCLAGILLGDPGVIRRSQLQSLPLPPSVEEEMKQLEGELTSESRTYALTNFRAEDGRSYCVRCFVWRPDGAHHCSTCGVCVADHDHHCGVFGRCIAGSGRKGNMKYYRGILISFVVGGITCISCVVWGLFLAFGWFGLIPLLAAIISIWWIVWSIVENPFLLTDCVFSWRSCVTSLLESTDKYKDPLLASDTNNGKSRMATWTGRCCKVRERSRGVDLLGLF